MANTGHMLWLPQVSYRYDRSHAMTTKILLWSLSTGLMLYGHKDIILWPQRSHAMTTAGLVHRSFTATSEGAQLNQATSV